MSSILYQGLQSCLESHLVEPTVLRLKLCSPKPACLRLSESCVTESNIKGLGGEHCQREEITNKSHDVGADHLGGWSFIQLLSGSSQSPKGGSSYVHPMVKCSPSTLSQKSLELCTENLGCETGTDIIIENSSSVFPIPSLDNSKVGNSSPPPREQAGQRQALGAKKAASHNFPPPLTTMSGSETYEFRPHREDGRLIIKAVTASSTESYFQVERSNGRLRLSFFKYDLESDAQESDVSSEDKEIQEFDNDAYDQQEQEEEEAEEWEDGEQQQQESDMKLSSEETGVEKEMGIGKFQRPSKCKEGGRGNKVALLNWERCWVAT
ncbi:Fantastic Four domain [Dillenia turbinata]|uniref:Fantastic Four domain n=1 Tax=Dillenia turbinata TaxID=194707 RepID=A0AAN8Z9S7_9MAGN